MREMCEYPSNWRCKVTLDEYLKAQKVVGLAGIDTRRLTRKLRGEGVMNGVIYTEGFEPDEQTIAVMKAYVVKDAVKTVTCDENIVYHADAHKHVPLMEVSPAEAVKNNVLGTKNLLVSASEHGVERFVQLSTDKAVNPTSVMGCTKRICEMLIQTFAGNTDMKCVAVRFGNVLGSHGSVIPLFEAQIKKGGPVTLTDPNIERYFMTIPEAAQLVLQAGALAEGGSIYVLDMGEPVKIMDLAKQLIRFYGYEPGVNMEIKIVGLRPGEKLYEELMMDEEQGKMRRTEHNKIFVASPRDIDLAVFYQQLQDLAAAAQHNDEGVVDQLEKMIPTFTPTRKNLKV